ncbi:MAG TPA: non-canonical purine NTP pyrophosphatase [Candidatus Saccharimonadales bacterium]
MRLIFATYSPGKLSEIKRLGQVSSIDVVGLSDVGVDVKFQETGDTYEANARQKFDQAAAALAHNQIDWLAADDSGFEIDALGGQPGVNSQRWVGQEMTDQEITDYTLKQLASVPPPQRTARLRTVVALGKTGQQPLIFEGSLDGSILNVPDKDSPLVEGFPLGQLFFISGAMLTYSQYLQKAQVNGPEFLSQRALAFKKVFNYINDLQSLSGDFLEK